MLVQGPATPGEAPSDADVVHFAAFLTSMAEELSQVRRVFRFALQLYCLQLCHGKEQE